MMLTTGWIVLDEVRHYTTLEVMGILASAFIICIGIKINTMKVVIVTTIKERDSTKKYMESSYYDEELSDSLTACNI